MVVHICKDSTKKVQRQSELRFFLKKLPRLAHSSDAVLPPDFVVTVQRMLAFIEICGIDDGLDSVARLPITPLPQAASDGQPRRGCIMNNPRLRRVSAAVWGRSVWGAP